MWPQGCSMRHRATKFGARSCAGLKNAALPRQAFVMFLATVVPPITAVPVAPAVDGVVRAEHAAEGRVALAKARDVAVDAALVVVEDRVRVRGREVEFDIGLDLAIGAW